MKSGIGHDPFTDNDNREDPLLPLAIERDDVLLPSRKLHYALSLEGLFDLADQIAVSGRLFKPLRFRCVRHLHFEIVKQFAVFPLEKESHRANLLRVRLSCDPPYARGGASMNLVFKAGARSIG